MDRRPTIGRMDGTALPGRKRRGFCTVAERMRIVKLTLEPVASVALANAVNANQVFRWKRQYERTELKPRRSKSATALVPVTITGEAEVAMAPATSEAAPAQQCAGSVTIE